MPVTDSATSTPGIDLDAVANLSRLEVGWADKGMPPETWGRSVAEVVALRLPLSRFPTPLLTLSALALDHNVATIAAWAGRRGLALAPHGKTTMAPQLWADQLVAGAWGLTLANLPQLAVARGFGVRRVLIANAIISPLTLRWISDELRRDPSAQVICWADSVRTVALMEEALRDHHGPGPDVLVEVGGAGGRTGARDLGTALEIGRAIAASPQLRLAGVGGYEGALAHESDADSLTAVRRYLEFLRDTHRALAAADLYPAGVEPILTAGGSSYFDVVADVLGPLTDEVRVVLRSGAYVAHDDGLYRHLSALGDEPRTDGPALHAGLHGWVRVSSRPEPGLALVDGGRRDLPYDSGLPEVQLRRGRTAGEPPVPLTGLRMTALNDQHGFVRYDPASPDPVQIGDELRLGLSHPCTAFDKWRLIPVVDDPDAADPVVVDLVRTYF